MTPRRAAARRRPAGGALLAAALLAALGASCRKAEERAGPGAAPAGAPAAPSAPGTGAADGDYRMADLAAATRLDARLQRLNALAAEYKAALTHDRGPRLSEHTDDVARRLDEAVSALDRALADVRDPRDRARAAPLVAAARRWPALLQAARAELLASPTPATAAAEALAAADDGIAAALGAYRAFRAGWRIGDSPVEGEAVLRFLRARRALEEAEAELGRRLAAPGGAAAPAPVAAGADGERVVAEARDAAAGIDEERRPAARRYVDAQARALERLRALAAPGASEEARARDALDYQLAKAAALEALAEYVERTAARGAPAAAEAPRPAAR